MIIDENHWKLPEESFDQRVQREMNMPSYERPCVLMEYYKEMKEST